MGWGFEMSTKFAGSVAFDVCIAFGLIGLVFVALFVMAFVDFGWLE